MKNPIGQMKSTYHHDRFPWSTTSWKNAFARRACASSVPTSAWFQCTKAKKSSCKAPRFKSRSAMKTSAFAIVSSQQARADRFVPRAAIALTGLHDFSGFANSLLPTHLRIPTSSAETISADLCVPGRTHASQAV